MPEAICSRMAVIGSSTAISTMFSMRDSASRGELACTVRQRAVVARVHRLQHVEGLAAAALADDDAVGPHAQRVLDQVALQDLALALDVRRTRLEADPVLVLDLQLGGVLDGDDPLVGGNVGRQQIRAASSCRCPCRPRSRMLARDANAGGQKVERRATERAEPDQILGGQQVARELSDGQRRSVHRQRRNDGVDARAVGQSGVDHRRRVVQAAADRAQDLVDDVQDVAVVAKDVSRRGG